MDGQLEIQNQSANPHLSPNQQDLLLAALTSQAGAHRNLERSYSDTSNEHKPKMSASNTGALFMSPQNADLDGFDYTPELDYLDNENFDFENADLGGDMIGAMPGGGADMSEGPITNGEGHEKRKSPDENEDSEFGDAKRQETQEGEKAAKKPGRKPLTSEPTTVSSILLRSHDQD